MNKKIILSLFIFFIFLFFSFIFPFANQTAKALVQQPGEPRPIDNVWDVFQKVFSFLWPILVGFSIIMFVVSAFYYVFAQGKEDNIKKAHQSLIWAVVGLIVGIVAFSIPMIVTVALGV